MLVISQISYAQSKEAFLADFLLERELKPKNYLLDYASYDFSSVWTHTENHFIFGILGNDHKRIKIKLISVQKNPENSQEYLIQGKSLFNGIIREFIGTINLREIKEVKEFSLGVDDIYAERGIKSQGILIASYNFKENKSQSHTGQFKGVMYTKWYIDSDDKITYDGTDSVSDGYSNNAFIGTWKSYSTGTELICNWADYRVPLHNQDFDIGAAEFSPSEKYHKKGWDTYARAWGSGNEKAKKEELKKWWE